MDIKYVPKIIFGSVKSIETRRFEGRDMIAGSYAVTYDIHGVEVSRTEPSDHAILRF